jgi:hypothetical protein
LLNEVVHVEDTTHPTCIISKEDSAKRSECDNQVSPNSDRSLDTVDISRASDGNNSTSWHFVVMYFDFTQRMRSGFVLCYLALRDPEPVELRDVQARLGIAGLIADRFEQPQASRDAKDLQDVFGEFNGKDVRVGMRRAKGGGWEYCVLVAE